MMAAAPATSIVVDLGDSLGILTDRDLRSRVVAAGVSYDDPVSSVMSAPAYTVEPDRLGGDVLLEMLDRGVRHFPVVSRRARGDRRRRGGRPARRRDAVLVLPAPRDRTRRRASRSSRARRRGLRPAVIALHDARVGRLEHRGDLLGRARRAHAPADRARARAAPASRRPSSPGWRWAASRGARPRPAPTPTARSSGTASVARRRSGPYLHALAARGRRGPGRVRAPRRQPRRQRVGRAVRALAGVLAARRAQLDRASHPRAGADPRLGARRQPAGVGHPQRQLRWRTRSARRCSRPRAAAPARALRALAPPADGLPARARGRARRRAPRAARPQERRPAPGRRSRAVGGRWRPA